MKRIIITLMVYFVSINLFFAETKWKIIKPTEVFGISWDGINFESKDIILDVDDIVIGLEASVVENSSTKTEMIKILKPIKGYIDIDSIVPAQSNILFKDEILTNNLRQQNKTIISESYFKALTKKNRDILIQIEKNGYLNYERNKSDMDYEWYVGNASYLNNIYIYNVAINLDNIFGFYSFLIQNITQINNGYLITAELSDFKEYEDRDFIIPQKGNDVELKLLLDGDYLIFLYQDEIFGKYIITDNKTKNEIKGLLLNNSCNLTNITWPRHADGSCDYDGSKKTVVSQTTKTTPTTNVSLNKTMTVNENLKLRSGEATTTQVLTVMSAGTKVKILELGKAETIDGINSNWVKVEVQKNAKDRDGKPIKAGTIGWCYGGYLK